MQMYSSGALFKLFVICLIKTQIQCRYYKNLKHYRSISEGMVPKDIPPEVIKVVIEHGQFSRITSNSFSNLPSCELMYIRKGNLTTIESNSFEGMRNATFLALSMNKLHTLQDNAWFGLENLKSLLLWSNKLQRIKTGAFKHLVSCQNLDLHSNFISIVEQNGFYDLRSIRSINLNKNRLKTLESAVFNLVDYLPSGGHPATLELALDHNPGLVCDAQMCWLSRGQAADWLTWKRLYTVISRDSLPSCTQEPWDTFRMTCLGKGIVCTVNP